MLKGVQKEQLKVPAHIDYLGDLRDFVIRIGKKHGFSDKHINAFKLAVDEAATNIIRHAYRESDEQGLITIRAVVKKNSLTLSLIDQGAYFDPKRVKDPNLDRYVEIGKKGGLGIFIMRKLMDNIEYRKTEEGNELRITKFRDTKEKGKLRGAVSASIPFSIKTKYFVRTGAIITLIIGLGYLYFFLQVDDPLIEQFLSSSRSTNAKIVTRIKNISPKDFVLMADVPEIEKDYQEQFDKISIVDNSLGVIGYSTDLNDFDRPFKRPGTAETLEAGIYKYELDGDRVYEFESPVLVRDGDTEVFNGTVHIFFSAEPTVARISSIRTNNLKLAILILASSYIGVIVLIYLVMNPFQKLSEWVTNLGHGEEIEDEIDIESSGEIGEIAKAFTDITHRFRESQKNLADQERLQKEMQVAQEIQQTLLPMEFPDLEGYELSAYYEAAKEVGGDYYDFIEVDKDTLGIAVADVSGKGVPGSLVMAMIRQTLRTEARGLKDAAEVLSRVNSFVINDIRKGMFVTVFYLIIDSKKRSLNYASAGHNPMILYRPTTKQTYYLNPKGFPIGVQLPQKDFFKNYIESDTIKLAKDDILLLYTDGITEAMNSRRELFSEERLQKVLHDYGDLDAESFVEKLKDSIYSFTEGNPQYDDITVVAIKEQSTREKDELRRAKEAHDLIANGMSIREACETVNLTTYAYYNKYKKVFEEKGTEAFELTEDDSNSVEAKHISIEEKTKLFDIIANHPEYGAGRIREELNTEKYGNADLSEKKIYDSLVRNRLNTRQLREAFVTKAQKNKRRLKPPGTPLMTLDGRIIIQKDEKRSEPEGIKTIPTIDQSKISRRIEESRPFLTNESKPQDSPPITTDSQQEMESLISPSIEDYLSEGDNKETEFLDKDVPTPESSAGDLSDSDESIETVASLDELLKAPNQEDFQVDFEEEDEPEVASIAENTAEEEDSNDFSFEELFDGGSILEEPDPGSSESMEGFDETSDIPLKSELDTALSAEDQPDTSDDDVSDSVAAASIDELLSDETADTYLEDDEQEQHFELEDTKENADEADKEAVSFSDLIQALDDEIVYVTDMPNSKKTPEAPATEEKKEPAQKEPAVASGTGELKNDSSPETNEANQLSDRELKLINGIRHYKNKEYETAIDEFKKVIDVYPDYKEAYSILGNAYFRVQDYDAASTAYEKVKEMDPDDITAYENMGVIFANRREYKQALAEWKRVLELNPERSDIKDKIKKTLRMI